MKKNMPKDIFASKDQSTTATATAIGAAGKRPDGSQKTEKVKNSAKKAAAAGK